MTPHALGRRYAPRFGASAGLVVLFVTAACTGGSSATADRSANSPTPAKVSPTSDCPPTGHTAEFGVFDAAMGLRVLSLKLTNCTGQKQKVKGYPAVKLFDEERQPLPITVTPGAVAMADPDPGAKPLLLGPGESAWAVMSWRNTVLADGSETLTGEYASLAALPGEPAQLQEQRVDLGTTGRVTVTAWHLAS